MDNAFGKALRRQMKKQGIKESDLAGMLSYDTTYISKWINGNKLPSARNVDKIIEKIVEFFAERMNISDDEEKETFYRECFENLKTAYDIDSSYIAFNTYNNKQMSFLTSQSVLVQLTKDALIQALNMRGDMIAITASLDVFQLYGKEFKFLMQELHSAGVKKIRLKFSVNPENLTKDYYTYTSLILYIIGQMDYVEMSVVCRKMEQPEILVIDDVLCLQVLWGDRDRFAAVFSMENKIIAQFKNMCSQIMDASEKMLDFAEPERLKKTNVQLDSYSDKRQWLLFNEAPAMLFPDDIMETFIEKAADDEYASYLGKLKNVFSRYTRKSKVDLIVYSSVLNKYISDGCVNLGNVSQHLNPEQIYKHLQYLSEIMDENPGFKMYLIRNTVAYNDELKYLPSVFLDTYSLNIESVKENAATNYHNSVDARILEAFHQFFENILLQSYCIPLSSEDLMRYL